MNYAIDSDLLRERLKSKVRKEGGHWLWTGTCHKRKKFNYGQMWDGKASRLAHRVSYALFIGPIPDDLTVDHRCNTPLCVNPRHLRLMTSKANTLRGGGPTAINARKKKCIRGHPYADGNNKRGSYGWRQCRKCCNYTERIRKREEKAAIAERINRLEGALREIASCWHSDCAGCNAARKYWEPALSADGGQA